MDRISAPAVLSLDIGTSSVRGQVYGAEGQCLEGLGIQLPYSTTCTSDGGAFIDLDVLCELIFRAIDSAVADIRKNRISIAAVSCCTFWHSVAGIDDSGRSCTPLLYWNETRPETVLPDLSQALDLQAFTARTGCPMHASYLPAKILWLHRAMSQEARRVRYWMSIGEYLLFKLTGQRICSCSMASATGLLDSAACRWDSITLAALPAEEKQLSRLVDAPDGIRGLQSPFAQRWPELRDALWFPALGDGACSNIGCGCVSPNRVAVMIGTSGAMRAAWRGDYCPPPSGLWCYRIDRHRPIQGGALSNGGNLGAWLRNVLDLSPYGTDKGSQSTLREIDSALCQLPPDGHGLTFLPFLAGQRSPRWNPHSTGTLHGLRLSTQPIHILQAGLEAVAYRFKLIHNLLAAQLSGDHIIVATGGGLLHSAAWVQILADVLGRGVYVSPIAEASCRGAALIALESLGKLDISDRAILDTVHTVSPRPEAHAIYRAALERHVDFEMRISQS